MAENVSTSPSVLDKDAAKRREIAEAIEHISSLSALSKEVPKILDAVGAALSALSSNPTEPHDGDEDNEDNEDSEDEMGDISATETGLEAFASRRAAGPITLAERKAAFEKHTREYFSLVRNVSQTLQSEIFALEEVKILPSEIQKGRGTGDKNSGGMGEFDIGVLNSRAEDAALSKRKELLAQARHLLNAFGDERS